MIKDHSDSEKGNPLPPHRLLFPINSKGSHRQDSTYHCLCYTSRGALAGTRTDDDKVLQILQIRKIKPNIVEDAYCIQVV